MIIDDFLIRAALAGIGLCLATGPLGAFVLWRRMAYFGDATAHAALLGVALAVGFQVSVLIGTLGVSLAMALIVTALTERGQTMDATLAVLSHAALAIGLVVADLVPGRAINLNQILFGDIISVNAMDLTVIWMGAGSVLALLVWRWQALLVSTLNPDLAISAGVNPKRERLILTLALAIVVAVALKVVGALLIGALLIIPAAAARPLTRSPEAMALVASGIGVLAVLSGLTASLQFDTATGPSIVAAATLVFAISIGVQQIRGSNS